MTVRTDAALQTLADTIRNEASQGANTAVRVGDFLKDLVDSKINVAASTTLPAPGANLNILANIGGFIGATSFVNLAGVGNDSLSFGGAGTSTTGHLRFQHNKTILAARNQAASADVALVQFGVTANDRLTLGSTGVTETYLNVASAGTYNWQFNTTTQATMSSSLLNFPNAGYAIAMRTAGSGLAPTASTSGSIRVAQNIQDNTPIIGSRNAAANADVRLFAYGILGRSNGITIGDSTGVDSLTLNVSSGASYAFQVNAVSEYTFSATVANFTDNNLLFGTNPASAGLIRVANNVQIIAARNAANTQDINCIRTDSANSLIIGNDTNIANIVTRTATGQAFQFLVNNVLEYQLDATKLDAQGNSVENVGFFATSSNPAASGPVRLSNNVSITWRNAANTGDVAGIKVNGSDGISLSGTNDAFYNFTNTSAFHIFQVNGTNRLTFGNSGAVDFTVLSAVQGNVSDASATTFQIRASGSTAANNNGGKLSLDGGRRGGTGNFGAVRLRLNQDDSTFFNMVEATHLANARRILALCRTADLTTTEMPTNTGDLVIYVGNAATTPTASAVGGGILYASAGALRWRGSGGTDTQIAAA